MYLYEEALVKDINSLFTNSKVTTMIADTLDNALKRSAAKNKDKVALPLIVLTGGDWNMEDANFYGYMKGSELKRVADKSLIKSANIIPFTPEYNMYILGSSGRECDMLTREIIFHYYMQPTLTVDVPYGINIQHTFNINFNRRISKSQTFSGLSYRTLNFSLAGAYLWHNNTTSVIKEVKTETKERFDENDVSN